MQIVTVMAGFGDFGFSRMVVGGAGNGLRLSRHRLVMTGGAFAVGGKPTAVGQHLVMATVRTEPDVVINRL